MEENMDMQNETPDTDGAMDEGMDAGVPAEEGTEEAPAEDGMGADDAAGTDEPAAE